MKPNFAILLMLVTCSGLVHAEEEVDFAKQVYPVLQDRCFGCHGPDKQKADLRLDTQEGVFGEDYIVVPKDPEESEMVVRISLPGDDENAMPPEGDRLSQDQIELIRGWIRAGAVWPEGLVAATPERPKRTSPLARLTTIEPTAAETAALEQLAALGISVRPVAADILWKTANLRGLPREQLTAALDALAHVSTLTDLNLADCQLTDEDLAKIASLTNLTRLHLEKNPLTDAGAAQLQRLVHLDYLNLYGTQVSDAGLGWLRPMKQLRKLYLWQTQVTEEGVAALQNDLPEVDVVMGATFAPPPAAEEQAVEEQAVEANVAVEESAVKPAEADTEAEREQTDPEPRSGGM